MEAVMLAAGIGWRLGRGELRPPKCLLRFDGQSLLERHLHALVACGVERLTLGVGYQAHAVHAELARVGLPLAVDTVYNPAFEEGNIVTLHRLEHVLRRAAPLLLMDADVLYHPQLLRQLVDSTHRSCLLLDRDFEPGPEPVKICLDKGRIVEFSKQVPDALAFDQIGESVGFFKLAGDVAATLAERARDLVRHGRRDAFYEEALRDLVLATPQRFGVEDISGQPWIEIDFQHDVEVAEREVMPHIRAREAA